MVCSPCEQAVISAQKDYWKQADTFLKYWVLKEAFFKCLGTGIDLQCIQHFTCEPAGGQGGGDKLVGYAWLWQGVDAQAKTMVWALCSQQPIALQQMDVSIESSIACLPPEPWLILKRGL